MRIGMILDKPFPPDPRVENEAVSLIENGHEVYLFCLKYGTEQSQEIINKIQVKRFSSNKITYKLSALVYTFPFYSNRMKKDIIMFLKQNNIDVVHIHDIQIAEAVFKANKRINIPVILDLHENRPAIMKFYPHLQKFPGKLLISPEKWKKKEEEFIKKASKIIVVTKESKSEIINRVDVNPSKIIVVPNTVHKNYNKDRKFDNEILNKYKNSFVLLYIGDTGLRRGLQTVIEGVAILKEKIKNIKLVIVGSNSSDSILKNQVSALEINNYVDFEGWQNERLFPSYIKASAICISPLHKNLHHDTTYANKIFQYMSFEKPLVVSNVLAQENIVNRAESGLIHKAEDSQDFAEKVLLLFRDKEKQVQLSINGRKFIESEFYWEKTSNELIELYSNLAE